MNQQSNIIVLPSNNGISRVKLNEPSTYNALSLDTLKSLIECFKNFNDDEKTKVIIIEGSGKGFSAGHDLKEINSLKGKSDYKKWKKVRNRLTWIEKRFTTIDKEIEIERALTKNPDHVDDYEMLERTLKNMNTLDCKVCETPTECSEDTVTVTCSDCVNDSIDFTEE